MNTAIIDVSEIINPVYQRCCISDDGNLLHNCIVTAMYTLTIIGGSPEGKHGQLMNDLHGYISSYTTPTYSIVESVAKACFDIINNLIKPHTVNDTTHITVLNTTRTVSGYVMRIGYYQC